MIDLENKVMLVYFSGKVLIYTALLNFTIFNLMLICLCMFSPMYIFYYYNNLCFIQIKNSAYILNLSNPRLHIYTTIFYCLLSLFCLLYMYLFSIHYFFLYFYLVFYFKRYKVTNNIT